MNARAFIAFVERRLRRCSKREEFKGSGASSALRAQADQDEQLEVVAEFHWARLFCRQVLMHRSDAQHPA